MKVFPNHTHFEHHTTCACATFQTVQTKSQPNSIAFESNEHSRVNTTTTAHCF